MILRRVIITCRNEYEVNFQPEIAKILRNFRRDCYRAFQTDTLLLGHTVSHTKFRKDVAGVPRVVAKFVPERLDESL